MRQPHLTATGKKGSPILQHLLHGESLQRQQILFCTHVQLDLLEGVQSITCTIVKTCGGLIFRGICKAVCSKHADGGHPLVSRQAGLQP